MPLEYRQKILISLIILASAYVSWQIYDMLKATIVQTKEKSVEFNSHSVQSSSFASQYKKVESPQLLASLHTPIEQLTPQQTHKLTMLQKTITLPTPITSR